MGEQPADLALREAHLLLQVHGQGGGVGADHPGCRSGRGRGLVGVASPHHLAAAPAAALVDAHQPGARRHRRDVSNPLLDYPVELHLAAAVAVGGTGAPPPSRRRGREPGGGLSSRSPPQPGDPTAWGGRRRSLWSGGAAWRLAARRCSSSLDSSSVTRELRRATSRASRRHSVTSRRFSAFSAALSVPRPMFSASSTRARRRTATSANTSHKNHKGVLLCQGPGRGRKSGGIPWSTDLVDQWASSGR